MTEKNTTFTDAKHAPKREQGRLGNSGVPDGTFAKPVVLPERVPLCTRSVQVWQPSGFMSAGPLLHWGEKDEKISVLTCSMEVKNCFLVFDFGDLKSPRASQDFKAETLFFLCVWKDLSTVQEL